MWRGTRMGQKPVTKHKRNQWMQQKRQWIVASDIDDDSNRMLVQIKLILFAGGQEIDFVSNVRAIIC